MPIRSSPSLSLVPSSLRRSELGSAASLPPSPPPRRSRRRRRGGRGGGSDVVDASGSGPTARVDDDPGGAPGGRGQVGAVVVVVVGEDGLDFDCDYDRDGGGDDGGDYDGDDGGDYDRDGDCDGDVDNDNDRDRDCDCGDDDFDGDGDRDGDRDGGGDGVRPSLPHPEESKAGGGAVGSGGSNSTSCWSYLLHCCFPFAGLMTTVRLHGWSIFWRLLPSILVAKAFWLSVLTLGLCDLAEVVYVVDSADSYDGGGGGAAGPGGGGGAGEADGPDRGDDVPIDDEDGAVTLTFGLWAYSDAPDRPGDGDDYHGALDAIQAEVDRVTTCSFHLGHADGSHVFFMDPAFRTARAFGVLTVGVGGMAAIALWLGAMRAGAGPSSARWRGGVFAALLLCCSFEGLTLLIFRAGVCGSTAAGAPPPDAYRRVYRDCSVAEGSGTVIAACAFWFLTGLATLRMPPPDPGSDGGGGMAAGGAGFGLPDERAVGRTGGAVGTSGGWGSGRRRGDGGGGGGWRLGALATLASERVAAEGYTADLQADGCGTDNDEYEGWVRHELQLAEMMQR